MKEEVRVSWVIEPVENGYIVSFPKYNIGELSDRWIADCYEDAVNIALDQAKEFCVEAARKVTA